MLFTQKNKKGQLASNTLFGVVGLVFGVVVGLLLVSILINAGLFTSGSTEANTVGNLSANLSYGVSKVSLQIPTWFVVIAAVILIGFVLILYRQYQSSRQGFGGSGEI